MKNRTAFSRQKIDRTQVAAMIRFVMNNIPDTDEFTLRKFMELMCVTGGYGVINPDQLLQIRHQILSYVPGTCKHSLQVLFELLGVQSPLNSREQDSFSFTLFTF